MTDSRVLPRDAGLLALAQAALARGLAPLPEITPGEARERIIAGNALCSTGPDLASVEDRRIPVEGGEITLRIYRPRKNIGRTVLYLHGGGWITGDLGYGDELCRFLARDAGCTVVSADYRLAPEYPYPLPLDDAYAALLWTAEHVAADGLLGIAGDSAGGNLAAVCALRARDEGGPRLDLQLLVYPVVDSDLARPSYDTCGVAFPLGRADLAYCFEMYAPDETLRAHPSVSPVRASTHAGLPPAVVVVNGSDPLHDEGTAYASLLSAQDVPVTLLDYPDLCHGFLRFTSVSAGAAAAREEAVAAVNDLFGAIDSVPMPAKTSGIR